MAGSVTNVVIFSAAFDEDKRDTTKSKVRQYLDNYFFDMKYSYYNLYKRHENYSILTSHVFKLTIIFTNIHHLLSGT